MRGSGELLMFEDEFVALGSVSEAMGAGWSIA
jgi:hypothetical protein